MDIIQVITRELNVEKWQVEAAVKLIDEGCTIPFISRYRKEATGTLNDEQLRNLNERLTYLRNLEDKKAQHSVIDVCLGTTLALFGHLLFYPQRVEDYEEQRSLSHMRKKKPEQNL